MSSYINFFLNLYVELDIMPKTPSNFNAKIRGKKIEFSSDDEKLISAALSIIWLKTNKEVESCSFEHEKAMLSFKRNESRIYFDLQESLSGFTIINKVF